MGETKKEVKLYGFKEGPFPFSVEIALKMKGVEYEYINQDYLFTNKSSDLLKLNPIYKKVSVLVHDRQVICESQVIVEYIDETLKSGLLILPTDPHDRALARFWARFVHDKCLISLFKAYTTSGEEQENVRGEAREKLKVLDKELQGKRFFGGDNIGFVDIVSNFLAYWIKALEEVGGRKLLTQQESPSVCRWQEEFSKCDIIGQMLPPKDALVDQYKNKLESFAKSNVAKRN